MKAASIPFNEADRLHALQEYRILGTQPEQSYNDLTLIAAEVCDTPIALMSLVDENKQWFKAKVGVDVLETPRDWSFCAHAIHTFEPLIVEDALNDQRFHDNPLVCGEPNIRFYGGFPLQNNQDHRIGTLCVIDRTPKSLNKSQIKIMEALARQAVSFLDLRLRAVRLLDSFCNLDHSPNIISTCSYCRKAKNEDGQWQYLDQYLSKRSSLNFSHGVCDACMEDQFPEVLEIWKQDEKKKFRNNYRSKINLKTEG